jgi:hypothetical protein
MSFAPFIGVSRAIAVPLRAKGEEHDAMKMQESEIYDYARQLLEAHGDKAVAEAAQKASALEQQEIARRHTAMQRHARPLWRYSRRAGGGSEQLKKARLGQTVGLKF